MRVGLQRCRYLHVRDLDMSMYKEAMSGGAGLNV